METNQSIDMQDLFFRFTMDSACAIFYGFCPDSLITGDTEFSVAFERVQERIFTRRSVEPPWLTKIKKLVGTADERQAAADMAALDKYIYPAIAARRKEHARVDMDPLLKTKLFSGDILTLHVDFAKKKGLVMTDEYLRDQCTVLLLAGRDTTGSILTSIFQMLAKHPKVEQRVVEEITEVVGGDAPSYDSVKMLKYCDAVFQESLRLYPPAPINFRKAQCDDTLPDGTFVPAGSDVQWLPWVQGRNPKLYPDPLSFKPERWLQDEPATPLFKFDNPAFHAGKRVCLGRSMTFIESKILMVKILQKHRLRLVPGQKLDDYTLTFTLTREHGQLMTRQAPVHVEGKRSKQNH